MTTTSTSEDYAMRVIARIHTDFPTKFGIPRQSGLADELESTIQFEPDYRNRDALRGIEGFSHLWLIWQFSGAVRPRWSPLVRPPRLGGNTYMGVFATRSPYRPNSIGLSCVRLLSVSYDAPQGPILHVAGADLMDNTPIFDIKPYLPYTDSHPEALGGFADTVLHKALQVEFPPELLQKLPQEKRAGLVAALAQDPRPSYQKDAQRIYGFGFAGYEIRFSVAQGVLTVRSVELDHSNERKEQ